MKIERAQLLKELQSITERCLEHADVLRELPITALNFKTHEKEWSILECLEHLNRYGDFYLPEMLNHIMDATPAPKAVVFSSGLLGNYFANLMRGENGKIKRIQSPSAMNPLNSKLGPITIDRFMKQLNMLSSIIRKCESVDLTRVRCSISLSRLIRLRLGDTLRFYTFHIERHVAQANRMAAKWSSAEHILAVK